MLGMLFDVFLFILTHKLISLVHFSPGSAKVDIGGGGRLAGNLMASCAKNICTKNY